jgi:putative redox protein
MPFHIETEVPGTFRHILSINAHTLKVDLGKASGGDDTGPGAHDLFDASLIACKALTAMKYAKTKGFALEKVEAWVSRDDSKESEGVYSLDVKLAFFGGLSEAEKQRIHEVIQRCPIHRLMTSAEISIRTQPLA